VPQTTLNLSLTVNAAAIATTFNDDGDRRRWVGTRTPAKSTLPNSAVRGQISEIKVGLLGLVELLVAVDDAR
jgi:hypothetical protein